MVVVFCGCRADWICSRCAKCHNHCECDRAHPDVVWPGIHSNSLEGQQALARNIRLKQQQHREQEQKR